jgi:hypothetical protein
MSEAGSVRRVEVEQDLQRFNGTKLIATPIVTWFKKGRCWTGHFVVWAEIFCIRKHS